MNYTIQDVADLAGVSKTTVSRYLNGHFHKMSAETKEKIADIIAEIDYRPNRQAQGLKLNKSYFLGVILADIENHYSASLIKAIQDYIDETNFQLLVVYTNNSKEEEQKAIERLLNQNIDGLMLQPVANTTAEFTILQERNVPTVLIDRKLDQEIWPVVQSDNYQSIYKFGQILTDKKYQRIIHITQKLNEISPRLERYQAIKEIGSRYDLGVDLLEITDSEIIKQYLEADNNTEKTAIFATNGVVLYEILAVFSELTLQIGQDYGLFGYDDGNWGRIIPPGLTGIYQNITMVGQTVAELLFKQIDGESVPMDTVIGTSITLRNSL